MITESSFYSDLNAELQQFQPNLFYATWSDFEFHQELQQQTNKVY